MRKFPFPTVTALVVLGPCALCACGGGDTKAAKHPAGGSADQTSIGATEAPNGANIAGPGKDAYSRGWAAWQVGDLPGAKAAFSEAIDKDPKSAPAHYSLATVLEHLGKAADAQQEYRASFSADPEFEAGMGGYALSLAASGHAGEADTFLADKHSKLPKSPRITTYLAEVKSIEKDSAGCQQLAGEALRLDPDYKPAMVVVARDFYRARKLDLANYALQAILDGFGESSPPRDPTNPEAHLVRGLIEREQGQRQPAMNDFQLVVNKRPDLVEAAIQLGAMKLEAGNSQDAVPVLDSAVRFAPGNALAHLNLGDAYRLAGRAQDAKREFDAALSLDSSLAQAHYDLGLLYLFSSSIPGTTADTQVSTAIKELETYQKMKGARPVGGAQDDSDELLTRAKAKQIELKNNVAAAAAPPPSAKPAAAPSAKPAAAPAVVSGSAKPDAGAPSGPAPSGSPNK